MPTARLTFLYPHLYRASARLGGESAGGGGAGQGAIASAASAAATRATARATRAKTGGVAPAVGPCGRKSSLSPGQWRSRGGGSRYAAPPIARGFGTSSAPKQSSTFPRHGTAVEPTLPEDLPKSAPAPPSSSESSAESSSESPSGGPEPGTAQQEPETGRKAPPQEQQEQQKDPNDQSGREAEPSPYELQQQDASPSSESGSSPQQQPQGQEQASPAAETTGRSGPMDTVLYMGPPADDPLSQQQERQQQDEQGSTQQHRWLAQPPHLMASPYVHHFDSYSLVKQLEEGGYSQAQAITAMKAVRALLAQNLEVAQAGLVSKSDVENETYLFQAACSELSAEVHKNRRIEDEQIRQRRTVLQHEADLVAQSLNQEVLALNDNIRGMFNDRKMAVREEQKAAESAIQQITYKISVMLNSDARSEIEGLRWVLIRRSVLGIIFMVLMSLGTLRYASYTAHEREREAEEAARAAAAAEEQRRNGNGTGDHAAGPDAAEMLAAN